MKGFKLKIKLLPASSRDEIVGWEGDRLKVKVSAPPVKGRANRALLELLSRVLSLPPSRILILHGRTSREKLLLIEGIDGERVKEALSSHLKSPS